MTLTALLGGSFDPVHNGHLHIAREILHSGHFSSVVFLPNATHNFKKDSIFLDFEHRFELVQNALEHGMEVWDDDATGTGFTSDLLKHVMIKHPQLQFCWVIGSDNIHSLPAWHDFTWLQHNVDFLVIPRPGWSLDEQILSHIRHQILNIPPSPVSSTLIREKISRGESISGLVPPALEDRIISLYKPLFRTK
jgi:nicotinate-nucleotide adenylyltransferase